MILFAQLRSLRSKTVFLLFSLYFDSSSVSPHQATEAAKEEIIMEIKKLGNKTRGFSQQKIEAMVEEYLVAHVQDTQQRALLTKEVLERVKQSNSFWYKLFFDWILKTVVVTFIQKITDMLLSVWVARAEGKAILIQESDNTKRMLTFNSKEALVLSPEQEGVCATIKNAIDEIHKNPTAVMKIQPLLFLSGVGGTGKTAMASEIQEYVRRRYGTKRPFILKSLMNKLPVIVRSVLCIYPDNKALVLTISGAYFYNQGDFDKAASVLDSFLQSIAEYILDHPERKVMIVIEEGETIFCISQFVTVLKDYLSRIYNLHSATKKVKHKKLRKNGIVMIIVTTNDGAKIDTFLTRRSLYQNFSHISEEQKLVILFKYLNEILGQGYYTETIEEYGVNIVRLLSRFSPSDIENLISMLAFNKEKSQIVTILDLLKIIENTLAKMQLIVQKQDENSEEIITSRKVLEIRELIEMTEKYYEKLFNFDLYDGDLESTISIDIEKTVVVAA